MRYFVLLLAAAVLCADLSDDIDTYPAGSINGQGNWSSPKNDAVIEDASSVGGKGQAIRIKPKFGIAQMMLPSGMDGVVTVSYSLRLATSDCKLIIQCIDSEKRASVFFYHDTGRKWGFNNSGAYHSVGDTTTPGAWTTIITVIDHAAKKFSVYLSAGGAVKPLVKERAFKDAAAKDLSGVTFMRNGQGDDDAIHIDTIRVTAGTFEIKEASEAKDRLVFSVPSHPRHSLFSGNEQIAVSFELIRENPVADSIEWKVRDFRGATAAQGAANAAPEKVVTLNVSMPPLPAGFYAVHARVKSSGLRIARAGSRPENFGTIGILPSVQTISAAADDARFGMQGTAFVASGIWTNGDPFGPLYGMLGARWLNFMRQWSKLEPNSPGQFTPKLAFDGAARASEADYIVENDLTTLICINGLPQWAIDWPANVPRPAGAMNDQAYAPKDLSQYEAFLEKIGRESAARRSALWPQKKNYYQLQWEPDWHYKGTDEALVAMYKSAWRSLHAGDPDARVMGTGGGVLSKTVETLARIFPLGAGKYLDGIATHAYYVPFGDPNATNLGGKYISPEDGGLIRDMRRLRALMKQYLRPDAKLIQSEWGLDYRSSYRELDPALLALQAAYVIRGHIILLGEGCDTTFFFYLGDYGSLETHGEDGYGLMFNLTMPKPSFGPTHVAPKPVFMASAAMTRILEGTSTIGPLPTADGLHAYVFKRGDGFVTAVWASKNTGRSLTLGTGAEKTGIVDFMGNQSVSDSPSGTFVLTPEIYPVYVMTKTMPTLR